jgi:hypothetical protein
LYHFWVKSGSDPLNKYENIQNPCSERLALLSVYRKAVFRNWEINTYLVIYFISSDSVWHPIFLTIYIISFLKIVLTTIVDIETKPANYEACDF